MKAVGKNIVIKEHKESTTSTEGGLILGEKQREDIRYRKGVIVLPGNEVNTVKPGDDVYFDRHAGFNIEVKDTIYKIIKEGDIVIVL
tara:strand:+ start:296 stop:556 length:261 start_codon:yes stop_codon:yes gene_type:complete